MDSGRFFSFDPFDAFDPFVSPLHSDPFGYYYQQQQAQSAAGRRARGSRWIDDFFPFAQYAEPAPRAPAAARRKGRKQPREEKSTPIEIRVDGPDDPEPTPRREEEKTAPIHIRVDGPDDASKPPAPSAEAAAVMVQAAARGFLARRSVRAVLQVQREAEALGRLLCDRVELLRGCDRSRAAAGEAMMRLVLRLDAVRGARGYRRKITREILALQDAVDALGVTQAVAVADDQVAEVPDATENGEEMEDAAAVGTHAEPVAVEMMTSQESAVAVDVTSEESAVAVEVTSEEKAVAPELSADAAEHSGEMGSSTTADTPNKMEVVVDGATAASEPDAGAEEEKEPEDSDDADDGEWEMVAASGRLPACSAAPEAPRQEPAAQEITRPEDATGRLAEMVAALCERNAQQDALIGALVERVDALERTVRRMEEAERRAKLRGDEGREAATA